MKKIGLFILIFTALFTGNIINVNAVNTSCIHSLTWDLVDGNNKIDYIDNSQYGMISLAQYQWTKYGHITIQPDTLFTQNDLTVSDYYEVSGTMGYTSPSGIMKFNTYMFDNMNFNERFKTAMHELGHALGIDHFGPSPWITPPVMSQGKFEATSITQPDKDAYLCNWG